MRNNQMSLSGEWLTNWGKAHISEHCSAMNKKKQNTDSCNSLDASQEIYVERKSQSQDGY